MRGIDEARRSRCGYLKFLAPALLAAIFALAAPQAAGAHGRKAVPSDPALFQQYRAGLAAYLTRDYAAALENWRPLAERERESSAAQIFLGFMNAAGQGMPANPAAAIDWYRRAAEQDNMLAQIRLGFLYRRGEGAPQDRVQAYHWASLAARRESHVQKVAQALREALAAEMTPAQIVEAERLTGAWTAKHGLEE